MSEFSQPHSTCSRTTDFSFVFENSAFSDAVLVVITRRTKGASIPWRLASSVAQLFVSAVEVSATTLSSTVPVGDTVYAAGKALGSLGQTVVSKLSPKDCQEVTIAQVYQVNSALLAASSPFLRHLIQHPQYLQHLVPGLSSVAARHRQRKLVTVLIQPQHIAAAEAVVKFIFTNDIALTGAQQALDALLVAEQLQVPDCAEVCQHYLEDCAMDWPVALTLVHLQHKHQQEQQHERQQQWQQQQALQHPGSLPKNSSAASVASSRRVPPRPPLSSRHSTSSGLLRGRGSTASSLADVSPLLPVPSESVYLQGLLLRAQDFLVHEFEDLELVMTTSEGRQRLLLLPYDALRAILGHPRLKVASENTALLAAAGWLHANASQIGSLLLNRSPRSLDGTPVNGLKVKQVEDWRMQGVYSSNLYNSTHGAGSVDATSGNPVAASFGMAGAAGVEFGGQHHGGSLQDVTAQLQQQPPTASGASSLLLDLCQVLRLCQCSYTYVLHVLPHLPLFKEEPSLVAALQFEVLRFRAAGKLRQRRLAAEAAAVAAAAAAEAPPSLTGHHLAGLEQQQQQLASQKVKVAAGGSSSGSSTEMNKCGSAAVPAVVQSGWPEPAGTTVLDAAPAAVGWRSGSTSDAALLQCEVRPESARTTLDFTFSFDPQAFAAPEHKAAGRGSTPGAGSAGTSGGGSTGSSGVDLMQRLLGLTAQQQVDASLLSEDHYFAGYAWNMVVAQDGFVGISWRVVLPGGGDVAVAGPHTQQGAAAAGGSEGRINPPAGNSISNGLRLFGPDCAGFRSPEVAVTFSITSSSLSRGLRDSNSSGNLTVATANGAPAVVDAAVAKPGSKVDQTTLATGLNSAGVNSAGTLKGGHVQSSSQQTSSTAVAGSPMKGSKAVLGRAYSDVQFVPAHCAWGFPDFAAAGWEAFKGSDGKVCLRCQLKHRE